MPKFAPNLPPNVPKFYNTVIDEAELHAAMQIEGIDEEIAVLRLQLKSLLKEHGDFTILLKGVELIARATAVRYRMSPQNKEELAENIGAIIDRFNEQLFPERAPEV